MRDGPRSMMKGTTEMRTQEAEVEKGSSEAVENQRRKSGGVKDRAVRAGRVEEDGERRRSQFSERTCRHQ